jgi:hypothetical protein
LYSRDEISIRWLSLRNIAEEHENTYIYHKEERIQFLLREIMELKFLKDTTSKMSQQTGGHNRWPVLKIVGIYAVCGILWIYLSDTIIGGLTRDALH